MKKYIVLLCVAVFLCACNSDTRLFQKAKLAASKGDYAKALDLYNRVIRQNPQYAAALTNRGLLWEKMPAKTPAEKAKNRGFAEQDYLRAIELAPTQAVNYNNLGALYLDMNLPADAIAYFDQALAQDPNYFRALMNRAIAYSKQGNLTQSMTDFTAAAQLRPHDPVLLLNRSLAYFDAGKYEQAENDLSHAIVIQPRNAQLYVQRARTFMKMGYPAEAYEDLSQAIELNPNDALAYYYLGDLMYRNGDKDYALGALVKAKELASQYAPTYELMGDMLAPEDAVSATANYMVALKLDPAHADRYRRKIAMMRTEEGRYRVTTDRFFPQGRNYNSEGKRRIVTRPIPTGVQAAK